MSTNVSVLCGRLTKDPILEKTRSDQSVISFTLAVDRNYKKENQPNADFINIQAWNKTAEYICKYGKKGTMLNVTGRIQTRNYDDKDGKKVYITEIIAEQVQIISSPQKEQDTSDTGFGTIPNVDDLKKDIEETF